MADQTPTIRLTIIKKLQDILAAMAPPDYGRTPVKVVLGPLGDPDFKKSLMVGLVPGTEVKSDKWNGLKHCTLPIAIEFQMSVQSTQGTPLENVEYMLGDIQKCVHVDCTLGGLTIDVKEVGNEVDLDSWGDRGAAGVVLIEITYRHDNLDPHLPA